MLQQYKTIVPFGAACFVATILQKMNLRHCSLPFDWVIGSPLLMRFHFLLNDFSDYFLKEDLVKFEIQETDSPWTSYLNKRTGMLFNHDFDKSLSFDEGYKASHEKYTRRIARLQNFFNNSQEKTLLLYMDMSSKEEVTIDQLTENLVRLNHKHKTNTIELLYFRHKDKIEDKKIYRINKYLSISDYNSDEEKTLDIERDGLF